jgi:Asp-tRNA(Asn)/Glu-tRNA(Gln) amidotransferase B subunit
LERALDGIISDPAATPDAILDRWRARPTGDHELPRWLTDVVRRARALDGRPADAKLRWAMGQVMTRFLGRVDPQAVRVELATALRTSATGAAP